MWLKMCWCRKACEDGNYLGVYMVKNNSVIFKGKRDGITIVLDAHQSFDELCAALELKMHDAQQFFGSATSSVTFKGRALSDEEENVLLNIIVRSSNLNISFAKSETGQTFMSAKAEAAPAAPKVPEALEAAAHISQDDNMTHFRKGSLRSGQSIHYAGSVVLLGDVNPGAEIVAEGNVVVLGAVKGMVHAGFGGNRDCYVYSFDMRPTQLRIADLIAYVPKEMMSKRGRIGSMPVYAYIKDSQIYIETMTT